MDFNAEEDLAGGKIVISFPTEKNHSYTIECTADLLDDDWEVADSIPSNTKSSTYAKAFPIAANEKKKFYRVTRQSVYTPIGTGDHLVVNIVVLGGVDHDYLTRILAGFNGRDTVRVPLLVFEGQQMMMTIQSIRGSEVRGYVGGDKGNEALLLGDGKDWHGLINHGARTFAATTSFPKFESMLAARQTDRLLAPWLDQFNRDPNAVLKTQNALRDALRFPSLTKAPTLSSQELGAARTLVAGGGSVNLTQVSLGGISVSGINDINDALSNRGFLGR